MKTPSQIVHVAHGEPLGSTCGMLETPGHCYLCGGDALRGMPTADWMGENFTDQTRARCPSSPFVCEACCYITSRTSSVLGRAAKEGNKFGGSFRNYSHCWDELGYFNATKAIKEDAEHKPPIRRHIVDFLRRSHEGMWFAAVAASGQKHVLPYAQMNGPGRAGVVLFDEITVHVPENVSLVDTMAELLTIGATKAEVESGNYSSNTWRRCEGAIRSFESAHKSERGSGWFSLALWLAQRDEAEVQARIRREKEQNDAKRNRKAAASGNSKRARGAKLGICEDIGTQPIEALVATRAATSAESQRGIIDRPVAGKDQSNTGDSVNPQLSLFST